MNVKFDLVRIGKFRKNLNAEILLTQDANFLKANIRNLLENEECSHKDNTVHMRMVIPGKGFKIKVVLQDIKDTHIRKKINERLH